MAELTRLGNQNLMDAGFDEYGSRQPIPVDLSSETTETQQEFPDNSVTGNKVDELSVGKLTSGLIKVSTTISSTNYVAGVSGWSIDGAGNASFNSIVLIGGTLSYAKTSFSDSTHAGYYISSAGVYFGAASDSTYLKYDISGATLAYVGSISGRSTATVASTINASGNVITDLINARIDTSNKYILSDFNFGAVDYSGALKTGTITWNTTTGAITGGSGVIVYRSGIVGAAAGVTTFLIDATTGSATFAGTLSAAAGTLGTITAGTLQGVIMSIGTGNNIFKADTNGIYLGNATFASAPFRVDMTGAATLTSVTLTGGQINYGKTSYSDSTNAGYFISSSGFYFGAAADATYINYNIGTGALSFVGTISGRATSTIASAINSSGNLINDIVNARINTSAQTMLAGFTFGTADYSGALSSGTITWNTTTGAITGGSGVLVYRGGIIAANAGNATITLDATTGNATFAGNLSAATGTLGTITANYITSSNLGAAFFGDGSDSDVTISADTTLTADTNYNNLTVNTGKTLNSGGYRIFVKGTLTINGTGKIIRNGNDGNNGTNGANGTAGGGGAKGTGGTAPAALTSGSLPGTLAGVAGADGGKGQHFGGGAGDPGVNAGNGVAADKSVASAGVAGADGGGGGAYPAGGTGGTAGSKTGTVYNKINSPTAAYNFFDILPALQQFASSASTGGSGGGAGGSGSSGGSASGGGGGGGGSSGTPGGILFIAARYIVNNGTILALGGNGGNGGKGGNGYDDVGLGRGGCGGGAGSGGSGGAVILIYNTFTGNAATVNGGSPGTKGSGGTGSGGNGIDGSVGNAGNAGVVISITNL